MARGGHRDAPGSRGPPRKPCRCRAPTWHAAPAAGRYGAWPGHAVAIAAAEGFDLAALGCNWSDHERFPDCRPAFWKPLGEAARGAYGVGLWLPLLHMTKTQVVAEARRLGVPVDLTWSCYAPRDGEPCGECLACETRARAGA